MRNINITNRSVCMEVVGYLLEELRDAENFRSFKKDIQAANIFIGSLIFIEELAEKVRILNPILKFGFHTRSQQVSSCTHIDIPPDSPLQHRICCAT